MNLTGVILTKNEEKNIARAIKSLSLCDEIIVIDDFSTDSTVSIAKKEGVKIYKRDLNSNWADQRNFALSKAKGDWILFIDADEVINNNLKEEIKLKLSTVDKATKGFTFKRHDYIFNTVLKHGEVGGVRLLRLARSHSGVWKRAVHEYWDVKGDTLEMRNPIKHYPHQTLTDFISDIEKMSKIHSYELMDEGKRSSIVKIVVWPAGKFIYNYFIRFGFLDGLAGFVVAVLMSFHSFLSWGNLWIIQRKK